MSHLADGIPSVGRFARAVRRLCLVCIEHFFGEPALSMTDFLGFDDKGRGVVNILAADLPSALSALTPSQMSTAFLS